MQEDLFKEKSLKKHIFVSFGSKKNPDKSTVSTVSHKLQVEKKQIVSVFLERFETFFFPCHTCAFNLWNSSFRSFGVVH